MNNNIGVMLFSKDAKTEIECSFSLSSLNSIYNIKIECSMFNFSIYMKDIVDIEQMTRLLAKSEKKIELYCNLQREGREYNGRRKLVWKNEKIAVSQGAIRLEFKGEAIKILLEMMKVVKERGK